MLQIQNGLVLTMAGKTFENGQVLIENGKIKSVGEYLSIPNAKAEVIDARGGWILPGLIDRKKSAHQTAHSQDCQRNGTEASDVCVQKQQAYLGTAYRRSERCYFGSGLVAGQGSGRKSGRSEQGAGCCPGRQIGRRTQRTEGYHRSIVRPKRIPVSR